MQINEFKCAVKHFRKYDVLIYKLMIKFGAVELKLKRNYFAALVTSIIGQQLSVHSARAIIKKFVDYFDGNLTPERILKTEYSTLRSLGLSNAKAKYVHNLSEKLLSGEISFKGISKKSENEIMHILTKVKGIGPWTVHMFLIFILGRSNILPIGDLGIRKAIMLNYQLKKLPTSEDILEMAKKQNWEPYSTYASLYLWKSLDEN